MELERHAILCINEEQDKIKCCPQREAQRVIEHTGALYPCSRAEMEKGEQSAMESRMEVELDLAKDDENTTVASNTLTF